MNSLLLSKNRDVVIGLRLSGIKGKYCRTDEILKQEFDKAVEDISVGILILTEEDVEAIKEAVYKVKLENKLPLVVTIPGPEGLHDKNFILKYVRESIGVKID